MRVVQLTRLGGGHVHVNPALAFYWYESGEGTRIVFGGIADGAALTVKESLNTVAVLLGGGS